VWLAAQRTTITSDKQSRTEQKNAEFMDLARQWRELANDVRAIDDIRQRLTDAREKGKSNGCA